VQLGPWSGCGESLNIPDHRYFFMPPVGFEPTTFGLKVAHLQVRCRRYARFRASVSS
jgi:hypothetical protein